MRSALARLAAAHALYPLFYLLNRPAFGVVGRVAYDVALRLNGLLINYKGPLGLTRGEEKFLAAYAAGLKVVLDVGANHGAYASAVRILAPDADIHAFEPHPTTFQHLSRTAAAHGFTAHACAMSDSAGEALFYDFFDEDGSTQASLSREAVALFERGVVTHTVRVRTIDDFVAAYGIARISLLKIDAEGHDLSVIRGARQLIANGAVDLIQFEFSRASIGTRTFLRDFFIELPDYDIYRICLNGALLPLMPYDIRRCEIFQNQNLVAVRRDTTAR